MPRASGKRCNLVSPSSRSSRSKKKTMIHPFFDTRDADGELNTNKVTIKTRAPTLALARFTCILLTENAVNFS